MKIPWGESRDSTFQFCDWWNSLLSPAFLSPDRCDNSQSAQSKGSVITWWEVVGKTSRRHPFSREGLQTLGPVFHSPGRGLELTAVSSPGIPRESMSVSRRSRAGDEEAGAVLRRKFYSALHVPCCVPAALGERCSNPAMSTFPLPY